ncbi:MAG: hypothetical protein N3I86_04460 [Verrucomicrobiae bacterium]|nr:hypothetical protein [Verrucomicrobiae bacterium]MDW8307930.1 hypothetical protein [Verrucomicrobiales bacterium]
MNQQEALQVVLDALGEFNQIHRRDQPVPPAPDTRLFGPGGHLDSLNLVRFVFLVEENLQRRTGKSVALTDERAMSQRHSPFISVTTLADYIVKICAPNSPNS